MTPPETPAAPPDELRLRGTILRVTYRNAENGYVVAKLRPETPVLPGQAAPDGLVALVGTMPGVEIGETIEAGGAWERSSRFGTQFKARWFKPALPSGTRGIEVYLASGAISGIGPVMAARIVAHFGEQTFEVLDHNIERLRELPKVGEKTYQRIVENWRTARGDRELVTFLGDNGISPGIAARLRRQYGENALANVRANPYRLAAEVRGIGFHGADAIARKLGLPLDSPQRMEAAILHTMESQADEGHTFQPRARLEELAAQLPEIPADPLRDALDAMILAKRLAIECLDQADPQEDGAALFLPQLHQAEQRTAAAIARLAAARKRIPKIDAVAVLADFEQRTHFRLAPAQREAALALARGGLLILTGGPGTGKTTTVRAIIELFRAGRLRVKLAAPTGRAARRLSETAKLPAETIHRMLGFQAHQGDFARNASNPVEADLVIVDEVSMLDVRLAADLLEAVDRGACLLLVGDEDQLPSVGPGNVLGDLIAAKALPLARLTDVFRQAAQSLIVINAHRINTGHMPLDKAPEPDSNNANDNSPENPDSPAAAAEPDFYFIERDTPEQIVETILTLASDRIPKRFGLDPFQGVQVLTPMRRGELGVEALNAALKRTLNPDPDALPLDIDAPPRRPVMTPGDRVMQVANDYDKLVFNGDIGRVTHVDAASGELHVDYDGRPVAYLRDELDSLTLAYATTIHKSQGSEYPAVIIPVHTQHWIMQQRNLIYTALTRARRLVCLVGTRKALRRAVANAQRTQRFTALRHFLTRNAGDPPAGAAQ